VVRAIAFQQHLIHLCRTEALQVRAFGIDRATGLGNAHARTTRFAVRCFYREAPVLFVGFLVVRSLLDGSHDACSPTPDR
jgi:hypothetical protein